MSSSFLYQKVHGTSAAPWWKSTAVKPFIRSWAKLHSSLEVDKTLAIELGPFNIRANAICPGPVEGERMNYVAQRESEQKGKAAREILDEYASGASMRKLVRPQDVADMAVFLASDKAALVSGQVIAVDGHTENPEPRA